MTLVEYIALCRERNYIPDLHQRDEDLYWQCTLHVRDFRLFYGCWVAPSPEAAFEFALANLENRIQREGLPKKRQPKEPLDINKLLGELDL